MKKALPSHMPAEMTLQGRSTPNPDPTVLTTQQLLREIATSREIVEHRIQGVREVLETRLNGMDRAIDLLQSGTDRLPGYVKGEVGQLRELHAEKFNSISTQFTELGKRTEQLAAADKTAIAAALQAQKEAAAATDSSNNVALGKMEMNFTKLIDQNQTLLKAVTENTQLQIIDLKSRLDKGEGRTSVSDPAVLEVLRALAAKVELLGSVSATVAGHSKGIGDFIGYIVGVGGLVIAMVAMFVKAS